MDRLAPLLAFLLLPAGLLAATPDATAVGEDELLAFVQAIKDDPAALNRQRAVLERLSQPQIERAIELSGNTHFTWMYPMILKAGDYPSLQGIPVSQLSIVALRGNKVIPIPFQIDEFDTSGLVYIQGVSNKRGLLDRAQLRKESVPDGTPGLFDGSDEFVFMYRDAGTVQAGAAAFAGVRGEVLGTLHITRPGLPDRYAYLMRNQPLRSSADYVRTDIARGQLQTTVADMEWDPRSLAMIKRLSPRVGAARGKDILDGGWGEVSTGLLQKNIRVSLDTTDNIRVQPVGVRDGAVRALMLVKLRVFYGGVPVFHDFINVAIYEQAASLPSRFSLDSLDAIKYFINFVKLPRIEAAIDFANVQGAEVRWQSVDHLPESAIVDGHMSDIEKAMGQSRLPGDWIWMDSRQGWNFFFGNTLPLEPDGIFEAFLEGMDVRMLYEDDATALRKGERYPGAGPRFGLVAEGMPLIAVNVLTSLRSIDFSKVESIGELFDKVIELDEAGKLDRVNQNINLVHQRLMREGQLTSLEQLADMVVADLNRMSVRGVERDGINRVLRRAITEAGNLDDYRIGKVLAAARRIAAEEGVDMNKLNYAVQDNTIWFPDTVGAGGPRAFYAETRSPPGVRLLPVRPDGASP